MKALKELRKCLSDTQVQKQCMLASSHEQNLSEALYA